MKIGVQIWNHDYADGKAIYHLVWQTSIAHLAAQSQTSSQCKEIEAQIYNPERNTASKICHAITLPSASYPGTNIRKTTN
jgi:hypothetical protein